MKFANDKTRNAKRDRVARDSRAVLRASLPGTEAAYNSYFTGVSGSTQTALTYRSACDNILADLRLNAIDTVAQITPETFQSYCHALMQRGKESAAQTRFYAFKGLSEHLVANRLIDKSPCWGIKINFKKREKGKPEPLTALEVRKILLSIPDPSCWDEDLVKQTDMRDRALIALMGYTVCRIGAALRCRLKDYVIIGDMAYLTLTEKGTKEHEVPIDGQTREYLDNYLSYCNITQPHEYIFQSANRFGRLSGKPYDRSNSLIMVGRRAETAGVDRIKVKNHTFRATGITTIIINGGNMAEAADLANHADTKTTDLYNHADKRTRRSKTAKLIDY